MSKRFLAHLAVHVFFEVFRWEGAPVNMEPNKCDELVWCPLDQLPANVIPYIRRALDNVQSGNYFDSFGWEHEQKELTPR
ncbi:hypothetical protein [Paenibacillus sp. SI8]|uniref:hypothetical protein n=1 Tax=unclassified Paenibacillus TaxID=185978 RepID=UPI003467618A